MIPLNPDGKWQAVTDSVREVRTLRPRCVVLLVESAATDDGVRLGLAASELRRGGRPLLLPRHGATVGDAGPSS